MRRVKGDKNLSSSASLGFDAAAVAASYGSHKHCRMLMATTITYDNNDKG